MTYGLEKLPRWFLKHSPRTDFAPGTDYFESKYLPSVLKLAVLILDDRL